MAKRIQILLIVFCLGAFIIPKQNFFAQTLQQSCCDKKDTRDCCTPEKEDKQPCHENEKNSCGDDCTSCKSCTASTVFTGSTVVEKITETPDFRSPKSAKFSYLAPGFSDPNARIWQPPKIG
jgi:hypothetical protein